MYMGNSHYWDDKFKIRGQELMQPEGRMVKDMAYFPKEGKILDLACGDGRNTIFLAELGYQVTAVDFSNIAVERLKQFALQKQLEINVQQKNLSEEGAYLDLGKFDVILINHYRLESNFYPVLEGHLKQDGILWINGFCEIPDFRGMTSLICENKINYEIGMRKFIRYIWRKPAKL
ncbi:class I SAM-dependent methyltransferase [Anaerocolumna sp. AGMB13025]|uniref:class I SAM-dependent methyltransferase n=1 Tax=Anaerocolumna sp. AGMB13025 TaxID=3039116 RepID=UPI00241E682C|nr:class I SAM-dependent methyltransferase [Anaerocolumna sp. AGMB13025]WFR58761.1 class I SAM-dependent methyltransferase [Anaerocolumna sp. AGMB13025]